MEMFDLRLNAGVTFESEVERFLRRQLGIRAVARNGTEHTLPEFVDALRQDNSEQAKFIRFAPDGVAAPWRESVFHWEAKRSRYIERTAWETYIRHEHAGCRVVLFLRTKHGVFWSFVSELPFVDSEAFVSQYPPDERFPVIDGWIYPRKSRGRGRLVTGSGTPYRVIDIQQCESVMSLTDWVVATSNEEVN